MIGLQDIIALIIVLFSITLLLKRTFFSFRNIQQGKCSGCNGCVMKSVTGSCDKSPSPTNVIVQSFTI